MAARRQGPGGNLGVVESKSGFACQSAENPLPFLRGLFGFIGCDPPEAVIGFAVLSPVEGKEFFFALAAHGVSEGKSIK